MASAASDLCVATSLLALTTNSVDVFEVGGGTFVMKGFFVRL